MKTEKTTKAAPLKTVTGEELALILGITPKVLEELTNEGIIPKEPGDVFILSATVQAYITYRLDGKTKLSKEEKELNTRRMEAEVRYKEAKANIAKCEEEELKGHLHRADDVEKAFEQLTSTIKFELLSLSEKIAVQVDKTRNVYEAEEVISKAAFDIIHELVACGYDKRLYLEHAKERQRVRSGSK